MFRFAVCAVLVSGTLADAPAAEIVDVGSTKQLLVDDFVVAELDRLTRVLQQPQRVSDEPILVSEHPWEGRVLEMPCVLWDPQQKVFHMYYWAIAGDSIYTCYVVLNPNTDDPKRRLLALYIDNVPGLTEFAASSPDGLHWTTEKKIGDLRHVSGGDVTANPPFFLIEQQWGKDPDDGHRYRAIWRTDSQDMKNWTGGRLVVERRADDDPNLEFYHASSHFLGSQTYHGLHFGYLYLFHTEHDRGVRQDGVRLAGTVDTALMVSRDTIDWKRVDRSRRFFPLGPEGSWEGKMNYVAPEVVVGDRMFFYYSGWRKITARKTTKPRSGWRHCPVTDSSRSSRRSDEAR